MPTNFGTALSASICRTPELVEDASPKWSSHLQLEFFTFLVSGVTTTYPIQFVDNSARTWLITPNPTLFFSRLPL
jgi:hypothetical protein